MSWLLHPASSQHSRAVHEPELLRRTRLSPAPFAEGRRRLFQTALVFVTIVLLVDALIGEKGLVETIRARHRAGAVVASLEDLRRENARLREEARRLREDPAAIESLAREDLGLIRPGEVLFIVKDARPAKTP